MKIVTICWKKHYTAFVLITLILFLCIVLYYSVQATTTKTQDGIPLPILMYHSVLKSKSGKYIITPTELEKDFVYLQEHRYTTITMADLIAYVENSDSSLPEKPIMLTFDDGCYNNLTYVVPLLEKYHMKAIISIVGAYTDTYTEFDEANPNYGYLRWKDIASLMQTGTCEFQNHTYNLHTDGARKGCMKKPGESESAYTALLKADLEKLQTLFREKTNYTPTTFTYPFGGVSKSSYPVIKELGFKASFSCAEGMNYITHDSESLYMLKRYNRSGSITSADFFNTIKTIN